MRPSRTEQLEILKLEMGLIQGTFDKYDDLIFRNRNWFITIWTGAIGLSFTIGSVYTCGLALALAFVYWFLEGMMRYHYWHKYVVRYRAIRGWLNESTEESISIYDLTNHYGDRPSNWTRFRQSFFKAEPLSVAIFLAAGAAVTLYLVHTGAVPAPGV